MPQFFFFDLLLISSTSSPGALPDYHSLHLLSGSKGSRKENRGSRRGEGKVKERSLALAALLSCSPWPHVCGVLWGAGS